MLRTYFVARACQSFNYICNDSPEKIYIIYGLTSNNLSLHIRPSKTHACNSRVRGSDKHASKIVLHARHTRGAREFY